MSLAFDPALLPAATAAERCAPHAERIDLDPGGSALWVDELIVVDVALPWPKPVWAAPGFTAVPELVMAAGEAGRRVRVLAAVPLDDGVGRVVTHRLTDGAQFSRTEHQVDPLVVADLLERLLAEGLDASPASVVSTEPRRELLLCTQGSHDVCCGSRGTSMHAALHALDPGLSLRRVSHTGGHRMAPTGVTLPDGRMWGMVGVDEMIGILRSDISPAAVARRCRGWIGVAGGPAQMAERAVMAEVDDWRFDTVARTAAVLDAGSVDGEVTVVEVVAEGERWRVEVETGRAVPTIACGQPGGLPAKPGAEWRVRSISRGE
ncbi:MAG: sucrase ferredoxin [Acidimicrobiales bacterium]